MSKKEQEKEKQRSQKPNKIQEIEKEKARKSFVFE